MNITYEREVGHCAKSNYVSEITVKELISIEGADKIEVVQFEEKAWQAVVPKGRYQPGEKVMFIPPEVVLPFELSEKLGVTKYLSKGRVKLARLRGASSQGLVVDTVIVEPYMEYLLQWEDLPTVGMAGETLPRAETAMGFNIFYKIPSLMNEPDVLKPGEKIHISEKIHGTNTRLAFLAHPATGEHQLYVGTHNTVRRETDNDMYWRVVRETLGDKVLPKDFIFYGEIYGKKVQHIQYDLSDQRLIVFAMMDLNGYYQNPAFVTKVCEERGISCVKFHELVYENVDQLLAIANSPSEMYNGIREGIVTTSDLDSNRMAKVIGIKYLEGKDKTERH